MSKADWNTIGRQLVGYAERRAKRYSWQSGDPSLLAGGNLPEDIAQKVIEKAFSGERNWDPDEIDLLPWLFAQVRSEISNLYWNLVRQRESLMIPPPGEAGEEEEPQEQIEFDAVPDDIFPSVRPLTPEAALLRKEYVKEQETKIFAAVDGIPELERLLEAIMKLNDVDPQELSTHLNEPVATIYQMLRRMRRHIESQGKNE